MSKWRRPRWRGCDSSVFAVPTRAVRMRWMVRTPSSGSSRPVFPFCKRNGRCGRARAFSALQISNWKSCGRNSKFAARAKTGSTWGCRLSPYVPVSGFRPRKWPGCSKWDGITSDCPMAESRFSRRSRSTICSRSCSIATPRSCRPGSIAWRAGTRRISTPRCASWEFHPRAGRNSGGASAGSRHPNRWIFRCRSPACCGPTSAMAWPGLISSRATVWAACWPMKWGWARHCRRSRSSLRCGVDHRTRRRRCW